MTLYQTTYHGPKARGARITVKNLTMDARTTSHPYDHAAQDAHVVAVQHARGLTGVSCRPIWVGNNGKSNFYIVEG